MSQCGGYREKYYSKATVTRNRICCTDPRDILPSHLWNTKFAFQGIGTLGNLTSQKQTLDGNLQSQDKITWSSCSFLTKTLWNISGYFLWKFRKWNLTWRDKCLKPRLCLFIVVVVHPFLHLKTLDLVPVNPDKPSGRGHVNTSVLNETYMNSEL